MPIQSHAFAERVRSLRFDIPPNCQGQTVEAAYACDPDGLVQRIYGSHPFSRVTGIFAGDDGHKPVRRDHRIARPTTDPSVLSAPGGLKPCAILRVDFCDDVVFATVKHFKTVEISLSQLREQAPQVWGIESEQALDAIRCRDRLEEITEVTGKLDSAALGKVLATAKALLSTQMLAVS